MLSWTYALKQEDSSLLTLHFPGKRQCYPGIDSQKDYKQGLHGVYDENEEEGIVCLNAIEYEHCLDGKMPRSGSVRRWYDDRYAAHDECHQTAHQIEMARRFKALEGEIVVQEVAQPDAQGEGDVERYVSHALQRDYSLPESVQRSFHLIIYNRTVGSAHYPFLQPEFRGIGLQLRSYRGTLRQ